MILLNKIVSEILYREALVLQKFRLDEIADEMNLVSFKKQVLIYPPVIHLITFDSLHFINIREIRC